MHYVSAEGITKSFGAEPLFENISFHISEGDKLPWLPAMVLAKVPC
jgi:ATP-binding cassette subfamily F protein uup